MNTAFSLRLLCLTLLALPALAAPDFVQQQLLGKWTGNPANYRMGSSSAASDKWFVLGAEEAAEQAADQGAVQVFNAATNAWVRKLLPPSVALNQKFGHVIEVSGDLIIVGAPATGASGKVYVFNAATGALIRTLVPSLSAADDKFGSSLSVDGDLLAVGAPAGNGTVWMFKLSSGQQLSNIVAPDPSLQQLGHSVDIQGGLMVVGAPAWSGNRGKIYWYSVTDQAFPLLANTPIPGTDANDYCGATVRLHQSYAVVACPGMANDDGRIIVLDPRGNFANPTLTKTLGISGSLYLGNTMDVSDGLIVCSDTAYNIATFDISGPSTAPLHDFFTPGSLQASSLALCGNTLLIGTGSDTTQANFAGAGIVLRSLTRPLPLAKVAAKGDYAPGVVEASFAAFSDVRINKDGDLALAGGLSGAGSGSGKDLGTWETLGGTPLTLAGKSRLTIDGYPVASVSAPFIKGSETLAVPATTIPATAIFRAKVNGTLPAIFRDDGTTVKKAFVGGSAVPGGPLLSIGQLSVPFIDNSIAFQCKVKIGGPITAASDSGLCWNRFAHASAPPISGLTRYFSEGDASGFAAEPGETTAPSLGEVTGPLALTSKQLFWVNTLTGPADKNQGLFACYDITGASTELLRKGVSPVKNASATVIPGVTYSAFLGITSDAQTGMFFHAQIKGTGVTTANNEGIWSGLLYHQILRKGDLIPVSATAKIKSFKGYWSTSSNLIAWVTLTGPGVTAANDQALILVQALAPVSGVKVVLMREGDPAPGLNPAKIGVIQQVDVEPSRGHYLILASLAGAPTGKDLALFRGHAEASLTSAAQQPLRLPYPILRKGILFDDQPSKLKSITLPANNRSASGAGNIGLGTVLQSVSYEASPPMVSTLTFDNGVTQVVKGTP